MFAKWIPIFVFCSAGCIMAEVPMEGLSAQSSHVLPVSLTQSLAAPGNRKPRLNVSKETTLEEILERSSDWTEPSQESEDAYVNIIRHWLATLEPGKRQTATAIMREAHPGLQALREAIREKKAELAELSFDKGIRPETLPRLGMELQKLRANLSDKLKVLCARLHDEAGLDMDEINANSFWLKPQTQMERRINPVH